MNEKKYHHNDLRQAIVLAALEILETKGLEGLSLRGIASQIGVSHAAPKHHFDSVLKLRNALAIAGFQRLSASMLQESSLAQLAFKPKMEALRRGYLAYAQANPALFRLMFNENLLDWTDPELQLVARKARSILAEACALLPLKVQENEAEQRLALERLFWSQIHGFAHLMIDGQFSRIGTDCSHDNLANEQDMLTKLVTHYFSAHQKNLSAF